MKPCNQNGELSQILGCFSTPFFVTPWVSRGNGAYVMPLASSSVTFVAISSRCPSIVNLTHKCISGAPEYFVHFSLTYCSTNIFLNDSIRHITQFTRFESI